jgi:hypothetical protein
MPLSAPYARRQGLNPPEPSSGMLPTMLRIRPRAEPLGLASPNAVPPVARMGDHPGAGRKTASLFTRLWHRACRGRDRPRPCALARGAQQPHKARAPASFLDPREPIHRHGERLVAGGCFRVGGDEEALAIGARGVAGLRAAGVRREAPAGNRAAAAG